MLVVLGVAALVADDEPDSEPVTLSFPAVTHDAAAATELVKDWYRWRTATFVTVGTWTRTLDGTDEPLTGEVRMAQDPPRRLSERLGAVSDRIDGTVVSCDRSTGELLAPDCAQAAGRRTYEEYVDDEMHLVVAYVIGDQRIYDVERDDDGCYHVELGADAVESRGAGPGVLLRRSLGALRSSRIRRQNATDEETTTSIRVEVTDADF
ncbi:MAG: hypothetical protein R2695_06465 [Acidimicrobiales bacterium]